MTKEELLNSDFLRQFKNSDDFGDIVSELYKRGVESMLEGEITAQLGYSKSASRPDKSNARNGHISKRIKTEQGELEIKISRDRKSEFEPQIVPKRSHLSKGIEKFIISLYAKGMSNSDIEKQLREFYGFNVSTSTISIITDTINNVFPLSDTQICVVHQLRNSAKYVVWKEKKEFTADMKHIYTAPNKEAAKAYPVLFMRFFLS